MNYRVFWSPHAEKRLENLTQDSASAAELAAAARQIDQALATDPIGFGESRYDTVRIAFLRPLGVQYDVLEDVRTVIVDAVWRIDVRG